MSVRAGEDYRQAHGYYRPSMHRLALRLMATRTSIAAKVLGLVLIVHVDEHGRMPTLEELSAAAGIPNLRTVNRALQRLRELGVIVPRRGGEGVNTRWRPSC